MIRPTSSRRIVPALIGALGLLAVFSSTALASGPPIVNVAEVTGTTLNTATIAGTIDPNGSGTLYKLEWGKTTLYGHTTPYLNLSGSGAVPVTVQAVGMEPLSTYHYRVSATNAFGTTNGADHLAEMFKSWKVEGTSISELGSPVTYLQKKSIYENEGQGVIEISGLSGASTVLLRCTEEVGVSSGALGVEYKNMVFNTRCNTYLNGKESVACQPQEGIAMPVNGLLAQTAPTVVKLGAKGLCPIGNKITFENGGIGAEVTLEEHLSGQIAGSGTTYVLGSPWKIWLDLPFLELTGTYKGQKFGIS